MVYSVVWYGMIWYSVVWCAMVRYGVVWYGMVWYDLLVSLVETPPKFIIVKLSIRKLGS